MLQIPVATSLNAKGTITDNHPLSVGGRRLLLPLVRQPGGQRGRFGPSTSAATPAARSPTSGGCPRPALRSYSSTLTPGSWAAPTRRKWRLHGDAKATLRRMIEALEPIGGRADWTERAQQLVREWRDDVAPRTNSEAIPIIPERLCNEITQFLPSDAMLVADTGHAGIWTGSMIDFNHPTQEYIRCAGSLGWGLSAAMGAKCALPDRPVLCFSGDGGFWYHIAELETAVRNNINVGHRHQQQQRPQPGPAGRRARLRRHGGRPPRRAVELHQHQLRRRSRVHRLLRHPGRAPRPTYRARWSRRLRRAAPPWWTWRPTRWTAWRRCRGVRRGQRVPTPSA